MSVAAVLALAVLWPAPAAQGGGRAAQSAYELGIRLEQEGRLEEALAAFSTVLRLNPKSTGALRRRGALLLRLERLEEAEADVDRLLEANLSDPEGIRLRGELRLRHGDFKGALDAFDQCLKLGHETSSVQRGRGQALAALGKQDEALAALDRGIRLRLDDPQAWLARGRLRASYAPEPLEPSVVTVRTACTILFNLYWRTCCRVPAGALQLID